MKVEAQDSLVMLNVTVASLFGQWVLPRQGFRLGLQNRKRESNVFRAHADDVSVSRSDVGLTYSKNVKKRE
ncbi:hypothetical protein VNO78_25831 [Psophocarpus tetragonolobus]|uniref:Uncharacterized protein n=1 Tax=Psophocarpus tetragonolobus TaxID=3891 RepID=A0AAN9XFB9_PSOTE